MSLSSLERSLAGELQRVDEIQQWDLDSSSRAVALEAARRQSNQLERSLNEPVHRLNAARVESPRGIHATVPGILRTTGFTADGRRE